MIYNHGINTFRDDTPVSGISSAACGIPYFVGCAPAHLGGGFKGKPQIFYGLDEAKKVLGYSEDFAKYSLCEAVYAQFAINGIAPAIFYNVLDPSKHKKAVETAEYPVSEHVVKLPDTAIINDGFTVSVGDTALVKGTDYELIYSDGNLNVELLDDGAQYTATVLTIAYDVIDVSSVTDSDILDGIQAVDKCRSVCGIVPDLLCAPEWSQKPEVAMALAAKAANVGGVFKAMAVVDLDCSKDGAAAVSDVLEYKKTAGYVDERMIVCWPRVKVGDNNIAMSAILPGQMGKIDTENGGIPFESPSNKPIAVSGACDSEGEEIVIGENEGEVLSVVCGVVTVKNDDGWKVWGNYAGCAPAEKDPAKMFVCCSRTLDWVLNTFALSYRSYIDQPLSQIKIDAILLSFNEWLGGVVTDGGLLKGEAVFEESVNPGKELIGGHVRFDCQATPPVPMQRIDMHAVFDVSALETVFGGE